MKIKRLLRSAASAISIQAILIIFLTALCLLEVRAIFTELRTVYVADDTYGAGLSWRNSRLSDPISPGDIEPWMTFAYINTVFNLPADYLETMLPVSNSRYPNISINRFVRMNHINENQFLTEIRQAVSAYKK